MKLENVKKLFLELEKNITLQNYIAQGNSRHILLNTNEPSDNFPNYSIGLNNKLNNIAFSYLSVGCALIENNNLKDFNIPDIIETGAKILGSSPIK